MCLFLVLHLHLVLLLQTIHFENTKDGLKILACKFKDPYLNSSKGAYSNYNCEARIFHYNDAKYEEGNTKWDPGSKSQLVARV